MALYDVYDIESRLKSYDPHFSIEWDFQEECHDIYWTHPTSGRKQLVMSVRELDDRTFKRIQMIDRQNGFDPFQFIEKEMDERDREKERKVDAMARDFADNVHKRLVNNYFFG